MNSLPSIPHTLRTAPAAEQIPERELLVNILHCCRLPADGPAGMELLAISGEAAHLDCGIAGLRAGLAGGSAVPMMLWQNLEEDNSVQLRFSGIISLPDSAPLEDVALMVSALLHDGRQASTMLRGKSAGSGDVDFGAKGVEAAALPLSVPLQEQDPGAAYSVCIVTGRLPGLDPHCDRGAWAHGLAEVLAAAGQAVTILYTGHGLLRTGGLGHWQTAYRAQGIELVPLPPFAARLVGRVGRQEAYAVYKWLLTQRFDCLNFVGPTGDAYYVQLARRQRLSFARTRIVSSLVNPGAWTRMAAELPLSVSGLDNEFMERCCVERSDCVLSPTYSQLAYLHAAGWRLPGQCSIAPFPALRPRSLSPERAVSRKPEPICFFGDLQRLRSLHVVRDAAVALADAAPETCFTATFFSYQVSPSSTARDLKPTRAEVLSLPCRAYVEPAADAETALDYLRASNGIALVFPGAESHFVVQECLRSGIRCLVSSAADAAEAVIRANACTAVFEDSGDALCSAVRSLSQPLTSAGAVAQLTAEQWCALHRPPLSDNGEFELAEDVLISVCIAHYNRPDDLRLALASLQQQDHPHFEVIICDDGSDAPAALDYLAELERGVEGLRLKVVRRQNGYLGAARNTAAAAAQGKYLMFLDDDNRLKPNALSLYLRTAQITGADIVTCVLDVCKSDEPLSLSPELDHIWLPLGPCLEMGVFENAFGDGTSLVRRSCYESLGGFSECSTVGHHDWELFDRALLAGYKLELLPESIVWYRASDKGMLHTTDRYGSNIHTLTPYLNRIKPQYHGFVRFAAETLYAENIPSWMALARFHNSDLLEVFYRSAEVAFQASAAAGFDGVQALHQCSLETTADGLKIIAQGMDPQLLLPPLAGSSAGPLLLLIDITVPTETTLELFHSIVNPPHFTTERSRSIRMPEGRNIVFLKERHGDLSGTIRLDPGWHPGTYILHRLESRSIG